MLLGCLFAINITVRCTFKSDFAYLLQILRCAAPKIFIIKPCMCLLMLYPDFQNQNMNKFHSLDSKSHLKSLQKTLHLCFKTSSIGIQKINFNR
jgi:hypothetical protein